MLSTPNRRYWSPTPTVSSHLERAILILLEHRQGVL